MIPDIPYIFPPVYIYNYNIQGSQLLRAMSEGTAVTTGALAQLKELAHYGPGIQQGAMVGSEKPWLGTSKSRMVHHFP